MPTVLTHPAVPLAIGLGLGKDVVSAPLLIAGVAVSVMPDLDVLAFRYDRTLAVVYAEGKNVNLEMVRAGLAEVYRGRPAKGFDNEPYQKAEDAARRAGVGMWSLGDKYVSPKEWRKLH